MPVDRDKLVELSLLPMWQWSYSDGMIVDEFLRCENGWMFTTSSAKRVREYGLANVSKSLTYRRPGTTTPVKYHSHLSARGALISQMQMNVGS